MQAIVHIGMSKTGSTALQGALQASQAYLASRGLLYPANPPEYDFNNHRLLATQFVPFEKLPRDVTNRSGLTAASVGGAFDGFVDHVARQVAAERPAGLVLSSEALFRGLPAERHDAIRGTYRRLGAAPRFIAYLRRPSEHYLAMLLQVLTASTVVTPPAPRRYRGILERYAACFGARAVVARLYHRAHLEKGDVIADFCVHGLAGFDVESDRLDPPARRNASLSAESTDLVARYRSAFHAGRDDVYTRDTTLLRMALAGIERRLGAAKPRLHAAIAEMVDYASTDCLWVRDRFGVAFPELDYDRLARGAPAPGPERRFARGLALDEVVVIDREMQAAILDALARSPWGADAAESSMAAAADSSLAADAAGSCKAASAAGRRAWIAALRAPGGLADPDGRRRPARRPDPPDAAAVASAPAARPRGKLEPAARPRGRLEPAPRSRSTPEETAMSPMRTLLHIGMPKSGTNALQRSLCASHAALAARGVLYPRTAPPAAHFNHKLLLAELFDSRGSRTNRLPPDERPPSRAAESRRFFEDLRAAIAGRPPRCLILSTESLFHILPETAPERFAAVLDGLMQDVTVVAYLRRPSEHYVSRLQQQIKASHRTPRPGAMKYRAILEQYAGIFGAAALSPNLFHRPALAEGDVVADFAAKYLAPYGVARADLAVPERTNDTISAESIDILRRYRLAFHPDDNDRWFTDSTKLADALRAADAAAGAPRPRLKPGIAEIADYARPDPLWLRDRHGIVFPDFDYRPLEAGRRARPPRGEPDLADILEIDRGRERAVLAELRTSPWTRKWRRRAWVDGLMADLA